MKRVLFLNRSPRIHLPSTSDLSKISYVISVYNEEDVLRQFWEELSEQIGRFPQHAFEVVWVNDGSSDGSQSIIDDIVGTDLCAMQVVEFSRNFGHEAAMIAGIDHATGDAIICMDSDLQHPPESTADLIEEFESGTEIITMIRTSRADGGAVKKSGSRWFYKLLNNLSDFTFDENASDFFLISSRVADILRENFRERNRFLRGYIQIIGFDKKTLEYHARKRPGGESKYSYSKLFNLANIAIFSFSRKPLYIAMVMAIVFIILATILTVYTLAIYIWGDEPPAGYTTTIAFLSISFAILFFVLAVQSLYLGRGMEEIKERPLYIVKNSRKSSKGDSGSDDLELGKLEE